MEVPVVPFSIEAPQPSLIQGAPGITSPVMPYTKYIKWTENCKTEPNFYTNFFAVNLY